MSAEIKELDDIVMGNPPPPQDPAAPQTTPPDKEAPPKPEVPAEDDGKPKIQEPEKKEGEETKTEEEKAAEEAEKAAEAAAQKKHRGGFQKRIERLTREKAEAQERVEALEAELAAKKPGTNGKPEITPPATDKEPEESDFATYKEFVKAQAQWEIRQALKREAEEAARQAEEERSKEVFDAYHERIEAAKEKYEDWDEVSANAGKLILPPSAQVCIMEAENGPDVLYWLAKNPEQAAKLEEMSPAQAAIEIGRISARLEPPAETKPAEKVAEKPKSKVPEPIKPLGGAAHVERDLKDLSVDEFMERRNKEEAARKGRR